jgi:pyruvate dehydrogenase E1 component
MSEKLLVPDIGDFEEVEVIEVLAKQGDQLNINDPVITIESDKSSVEIPSTVTGKIETVQVKIKKILQFQKILKALLSKPKQLW